LSSLYAKERTVFRRWVFQLLPNQQLLVISSCHDTFSSLPAKERTGFRGWVFQLLPAVVQTAAVEQQNTCH
jgi:hypothetical protein